MAKMRHWKQRFDFDADLVFRKRMVIRGFGVEVAQAGDPVPQAMKDHFGKNRMRIWWEGGFIAINTVEAPGGSQVVVHVGGGYYDVTRDGETTRIRGKSNIPVPF